MFQGLSTINNNKKGVRFLKDLVLNGSFEWKIEMSESDFASYLNSLAEQTKREEQDKAPIILISRLYLDADLVTEMTRDKVSNELYINRYPDKLEAHWLQINTDMQALNKLFLQIKVALLGSTSILYLADVDVRVAATFLIGNIGSFVFPKAFGKSMVFLVKNVMKLWRFISG